MMQVSDINEWLRKFQEKEADEWIKFKRDLIVVLVPTLIFLTYYMVFK